MPELKNLVDVFEELSVPAQDTVVDILSAQGCLASARLTCKAFRRFVDENVRFLRICLGERLKQLLEDRQQQRPVLPRCRALLLLPCMPHKWNETTKAALMIESVRSLSPRVREQATELTVSFGCFVGFTTAALALANILRYLPALRSVDVGQWLNPPTDPLAQRQLIDALMSLPCLAVLKMPILYRCIDNDSERTEAHVSDLLAGLPPRLERLETPEFILTLRAGAPEALEIKNFEYGTQLQSSTLSAVLRQLLLFCKAAVAFGTSNGSSAGSCVAGSSVCGPCTTAAAAATGSATKRLPLLTLKVTVTQNQVQADDRTTFLGLLACFDTVVIREMSIGWGATEDGLLDWLHLLGRWPELFTVNIEPSVCRAGLVDLPLPPKFQGEEGPRVLPRPPPPQAPPPQAPPPQAPPPQAHQQQQQTQQLHIQHQQQSEEERQQGRQEAQATADALLEAALQRVLGCATWLQVSRKEARGSMSAGKAAELDRNTCPDEAYLVLRGGLVSELLAAGKEVLRARMQAAGDQTWKGFHDSWRMSYVTLQWAGCVLVYVSHASLVVRLCQALAAVAAPAPEAGSGPSQCGADADDAPAESADDAEEIGEQDEENDDAMVVRVEAAVMGIEQLGGLLGHGSSHCRSFSWLLGAEQVLIEYWRCSNTVNDGSASCGGVHQSPGDGGACPSDPALRLWARLRVVVELTRQFQSFTHACHSISYQYRPWFRRRRPNL